MQLKNKVCLVAGASGAIGSALAERFYEEGARLALTSRIRRIGTAKWQDGDDKRVLECQLDVRDGAEVQAKISEVCAHFGGIDVMVNCTGVLRLLRAASQ